MSKIHKCPFCLYSFERASAIPEEADDITIYRCPNPKEKSNGQKFCDRQLPLNFFDAESTIISIAGSKYVGKTYYLIALLMQLKRNKSFQRLGFSGELIGDPIAKKDIEDKIAFIKKGNILDPTTPGEIAHEQALVIDLTIKKGKTNKHIYLSFFDTPGESYNNLDWMIRNLQCIYKADGLLFLVEPMQIESLRPTIFETYPDLDNLKTHDLHEVFYNVLQLLIHVQRNKKVRIQNPKPNIPPVAEKVPNEQPPTENANTEQPSAEQPPKVEQPNTIQEPEFKYSKQTFWQRIFGKEEVPEIIHEKLKCPIAIGITKIDQIKSLMFNEIPQDYIDFDTMCLKGDKINTELIDDISSEIKEIVFHEEDGEIAIRNMLEAEAKHYEFFGIKSGTVDAKGKKVVSMENQNDPQGVLLPLIWLLIKLKLY